MTEKVTKLGKELRKIRIDQGLRLYDMAKTIGISAAMLSAVETNRKAAPNDLIERLARHYEVIKLRQTDFERLADLTKKEVRMSLNQRENATELAVAFARRFNKLTDEQIAQITDVLEVAES